MAVNRFDKPIDAQFMNTYVPIPFDQMVQAGALKQQRYDQGAASLDQSIARAEDMPAIANSKDALNRDEALRKVYAIRDKYMGKDLSNALVTRQLNNEIRSAVKPEDIRSWAESHMGWQTYQKQKAQMEARGQKVYGDVDFSGYDSSVTGTFTGLPAMDLGAQAEKYIDDFMTKPQQDWRQLDLGKGRVGIEHYRDINKIRNRINSKIGELTNNPAIQQLMEREGMTEETFKEFLLAKAPDYEKAQLTSTYAAGSGSRSEGIPRPYVNRIDLPADVANVTGREVRARLKNTRTDATKQQVILDNLIKSSAPEDEIAIQKENVQNANELLAEQENEYNKIADSINEQFVEQERGVTNEYLNKIMEIGDLPENQVRQYLDIAMELGSKPGLAQTGMTSFIDIMATEVKKELPEVPFKVRRQLAAYASQMNPIAATKTRALDAALNEAFSEATTTQAVTLRQQKNTNNGYMQYAGINGEMYDSFIHASVTDPLKKSPGSFEMHAEDYSLENKKDLDKYVRLSSFEGVKDKDKGYSMNLLAIKEAPNAKGGADLYYTLSGPDIPGDLKTTTVTVSVNKPEQIQNIMSDLIMQGDTDAALNFAHGAFMPLAQRDGAGSYEIQYPNNTGVGDPVYVANADVVYNNDTEEYDIMFAGIKAGSAENRKVLGMALINLQKWAIQNADYLSGNK